MTVMLAEVYDALRSRPGMDETKARRAAEALGVSETRASTHDGRFDRLESEVDRLDAGVLSLMTDVTLLKWMAGFVLGGIVIALGKLLTL